VIGLESNRLVETAKFGSPVCFLEYEILFLRLWCN
jgi:hypothetical protein